MITRQAEYMPGYGLSGQEKKLGYHWPYPGIGMAEAKDGAYVYVPVS